MARNYCVENFDPRADWMQVVGFKLSLCHWLYCAYCPLCGRQVCVEPLGWVAVLTITTGFDINFNLYFISRGKQCKTEY
jgi:hypothetical protein